MTLQEVLVERAIVMIVVAAGLRAGVEGKALMARPILADILVTERAIVLRQRHTHRGGDLGAVFGVAGDALRGLEFLQSIGVAGIEEFLGGVGVFRLGEIRAMTADTGLLDRLASAERRRVAGRAGKLDLVVAARHFTDDEARASCATIENADNQHDGAGDRREHPEQPDRTVARHMRAQ